MVTASRTLVLPEYSGATPGLQWPLIWPAKDPGDELMDFSLDVSGWLTAIQDQIESFTVGWSPIGGSGDLQIVQAFSHNGVVTILASDGNSFVTYVVTLNITASLTGEVLSRSINLPVMPLYTDSSPVSGSISGLIQ